MSIYGCRLMCTIPQLESYFIDRERNISTSSKQSSSNFSKKEMKTEKEPLRSGVSCLTWGPEGYHLLVACRSSNSCNSTSSSSSSHENNNNNNNNGIHGSKSNNTTADMSGKFIQFSFMKSCLTTNPNMVF